MATKTIGSYKGVPIYAGDDAYVASQMAKVDGGAVSPTVQASLPPAVAPTNAADVKSSTSLINMPSMSLPAGNPGGAIANTAGIAKGLDVGQKYAADQQKIEELRASASAENNKTFLSKLMSPKEATDAARKAEKDAGVDPIAILKAKQTLIEETNQLSKQYAEMSGQKDQELSNIQTRGGSTTEGITQALTVAERNANIRLNTLSAKINANNGTLNALSGQYTQAMDYIEQASTEALAESKFKFEQYNVVETQNKALFDNMSSNYKEAWDIAKNEAEMQYQQNKDSHDTIAGLFEAAAKAGAPASTLSYLSSLIAKTDLTDADIAKAYSTTGSFASGKSSDSSSSFTTTQLNDGASTAGVPISTFKGFSSDLKNMFISNKGFQDDWSAFKSGSSDAPSYDEFVSEINATASISASDKATLISLLGEAPKKEESSGGIWQTIKSFFTRDGK